jgi:alpha-glucosidase
MKDFGYDISDYKGISPLFGDMKDFDMLLDEVHKRGMKLILDLVPNHTSDEHPWFKESRSSKDNPKRDWYIWRDAAPGKSYPNNWKSVFGGSAWQYDPTTNQYYLHQFLKEQPELNYHNPEVFEAMKDVIKFWLNKGVDGFRVDVIWLMMKDPELRDEPEDPAWNGVKEYDQYLHIYSQNIPEIHDLIRKMRAVFDEYGNRVLIGEIYLPLPELVKYYGRENDECHLPFNFVLVTNKWNATTVRSLVTEYEKLLPSFAWPNWVLGNHDNHRVASRVGPAQAGVANLLLMTLRGTPTTYYGEELAMENITLDPQQLQDPYAIQNLDIADLVGRDPERSPMQWNAGPNAGFCEPGVKPWLPLHPDSSVKNVESEGTAEHSPLAYYRHLSHLRKTEPALCLGDYLPMTLGDEADQSVFCYVRRPSQNDVTELAKQGIKEPSSFLVLLNFTAEPIRLDVVKNNHHTFNSYYAHAKIRSSTLMTHMGDVVDLCDVHLRANEGLLVELTKQPDSQLC